MTEICMTSLMTGPLDTWYGRSQQFLRLQILEGKDPYFVGCMNDDLSKVQVRFFGSRMTYNS